MTSSNKWVSTSTPYLTPRAAGTGDAWTEEAAQQGRRGTQKLAEAREVPAPDDIAHALELAPGSTVIVRRRVICLDDLPVELADTYYPTRIARGTPLAEPRKIPGGAPTLMATLGHKARRVREDVTARTPTPEEREALRLPQGQPVLSMIRTVYGDDGQPIQADTMTAARRLLRYEIEVD